MAEVGYLIGAGASAGCVPVVNQMGEYNKEILTKFYKTWGSSNRLIDLGNSESLSSNLLTTLCTRIVGNITKYSLEHSSIDTYAKKLFISGKSIEYRQLKNDMAFYFTLIQILNLPDKRYDNFWASVLNNKIPPKKLNIFSWNYDFQFEKSYMEFSGQKTLDGVWDSLSICSPWCQMDRDMENEFHFTKLNGSARLRPHDGKGASYYCNFEQGDVISNIENLFKSYHLSQKSTEDTLNCELEFAWETFPRNKLLENITPVLQKIEVLVIIGYSFPFFNRKIDQELIKGMTSLQRIIIQDTNPEGIEERLKEFIYSGIHIGLRRDVGQFVFPIELEV